MLYEKMADRFSFTHFDDFVSFVLISSPISFFLSLSLELVVFL